MILQHRMDRGGGAAAGVFTFLAFLFAVLAVLVALFKDPWQSGFGIRNPFGSPLSRYDFKTPAGAYKAELEIELHRDAPANMELGRITAEKRTREKVASFKAEREGDYSRKEGEKEVKYKVLFATWKEDGKDVKRVVAMRWDDETEMWQTAALNSGDVKDKNPELAKQMQEWR